MPATRHFSLLLAALVLAGCADEPSGPATDDLAPLRAAALGSDALLAGSALGPGAPTMIGGGVGPLFVGPPTLGGPRGGSGCRYDAATGRTECGPFTANGLTFTSSFAFFDAAGAAQAAFGPTTDRVNARTRMSGTTTLAPRSPGAPGGNVALTIDRRNDQTTSGFTDPAGRRRTDGTGEGTETAVVSGERGTVRIERTFVDTTTNLVVQVPPRASSSTPPTSPTFVPPLSGRIVRVSRAVETAAGRPARTTDVRAVTEFLAGGIARTTITVNGVTRVCTQNLTRPERPSCS